MSVRASAWAWEVKLPYAQKLVLLRLADTARDDGTNAWRAIARMVDETGLCERAIRNALRALEAAGLIVMTAPADPGQKRATIYRLALPETPAPDAPLEGQDMPPSAARGVPDAPVEGHVVPARGAPDAPTPYYSVEDSGREGGACAPTHPPARHPGQQDLLSDEDASNRRQGRGRAQGTRLPADWRPSPADRAFAQNEGLDEQTIEREAEKFRDHFLGKAGAAGRKADWPATWRNWCRRSTDGRFSGGPRRAGPGGDVAEVFQGLRQRGYGTVRGHHGRD